MPRRLDERMVVEAKRDLIAIVKKEYPKGREKAKELMQRDFVLKLQHYKELRRYSVEKGTHMTDDDWTFEQNLMAKAVICGLFDTVKELAEKAARGEEETLRLGRTLEGEEKLKTAHGYSGAKTDYDVDVARMAYRASGMNPKEVEDRLKTDVLELEAGGAICHVCKRKLGGKFGLPVRETGKIYCAKCWDFETERGNPLILEGVPIQCSVCGKQIKIGWTLWHKCPEGVPIGPKCTWWCRHCYFELPENQEQKARFLKKLNGRKPRPEV